MALSTLEDKRVQTIETKLNEVQTAISKLVTIAQLKQLLLLKQQEIDDLKNRVTSLESQIAVLQAK